MCVYVFITQPARFDKFQSGILGKRERQIDRLTEREKRAGEGRGMSSMGRRNYGGKANVLRRSVPELVKGD